MSENVSWGQRREELEQFVDSVTSSYQPQVLDDFESVIGIFEDILEDFHGYEDVSISRTPGSMCQTFSGPVMGGKPKNKTRKYLVESEESQAVFEFGVSDYSVEMYADGREFFMDNGDFRKLTFRKGNGDEELYNDVIREFQNHLGTQVQEYEDSSKSYIKVERDDVADLRRTR